VQAGNTGPGSGHNTINEATTIYTPTGIEEINKEIQYQFFPNPTKDFASVYFFPSSTNNIKGALYNLNGQIVQLFENFQPGVLYTLDFTKIPSGIYSLMLQTNSAKQMQRIVKVE
jgi:hypothetical protein